MTVDQFTGATTAKSLGVDATTDNEKLIAFGILMDAGSAENAKQNFKKAFCSETDVCYRLVRVFKLYI